MTIRLDERALHERFKKLQDQRPAQEQDHQPGDEHALNPRADCGEEIYEGSGKLSNRVAIITGGDSGIGRAVAIAFAREGADVVIAYLDEHDDAEDTAQWVRKAGRRCITVAGDVGSREHCDRIIAHTREELGRLDILVNNAAEQHVHQKLEENTTEEIEKTFRTNIFAYIYMAQAILPHLQRGGTIINTASVTAYQGNDKLIPYSSTKGAIVAFTRSLAKALAEKGIRVNAVAPGPVWTPLIPSTFPGDAVEEFGDDRPIGRAAQPVEMASAYVYLACPDSSCMTGQTLHPNCGVIVNG